MAVKIEKETIIGDILDVAPQAAPLFFAIGMHCLPLLPGGDRGGSLHGPRRGLRLVPGSAEPLPGGLRGRGSRQERLNLTGIAIPVPPGWHFCC